MITCSGNTDSEHGIVYLALAYIIASEKEINPVKLVFALIYKHFS